MIPVTSFKDKGVAVFGLGVSGLATARALTAGGARVMCYDDNANALAAAAEAGFATGEWRQDDFSAYTALILAPGVPLTHPKPHEIVTRAREAGLEIIGDIELFCRERKMLAPESLLIAITGTNGKSTTTALIAHLLKKDGRRVSLGGNIGKPILALEALEPKRIYVIECSSYQIDLSPSLEPSIGILLNVSEDHLDRHGTLEHYASVKERLVARAGTAVISVDDPWSRAIAARRAQKGGATLEISTQNRVARGISAIAGRLVESTPLPGMVVADLSAHPVLRGVHNAENAAAAVAAVRALGLGLDAVRQGLLSFPGLAHRMQPVGRYGTLTFINDSKATNADAAAKALACFNRIYWIAGGLPKTGGITALSAFFPRIVKAYLIGTAAESFAATLSDAVPHTLSGTLEQAVHDAFADAAREREEAVVLLSPAAASFDQFKNFEERGEAFTALVLAQPGVLPIHGDE